MHAVGSHGYHVNPAGTFQPQNVVGWVALSQARSLDWALFNGDTAPPWACSSCCRLNSMGPVVWVSSWFKSPEKEGLHRPWKVLLDMVFTGIGEARWNWFPRLFIVDKPGCQWCHSSDSWFSDCWMGAGFPGAKRRIPAQIKWSLISNGRHKLC